MTSDRWNNVADHADAIEDVAMVLHTSAQRAGRMTEATVATVAQLAASACSEVTDMVQAATPEARMRSRMRAHACLMNAVRALESIL